MRTILSRQKWFTFGVGFGFSIGFAFRLGSPLGFIIPLAFIALVVFGFFESDLDDTIGEKEQQQMLRRSEISTVD